ncbi:MAG: GAF domain-containing protein [Deltaproteobacteria bacterium]|jgi:GAF domain-containing protein|nr:GAF domain-containing protein [Deltaproteobacteria bacterium]
MADKKKDYFHDLYEVCVVINSSLETHFLMKKIAEQLAASMHAKACSIRLLDQTGEALEPSTAFGLSKGYVHKGKVLIKKSQIDEEVLGSGKLVYIDDISTDKRWQYPEAARTEGLASVLIAPLKVEGRCIGVVRVYTAQKEQFTEEDREFLMAVTHLAAISIENARLHQALKADYELQAEFNYNVFED